MPKPVRRAKVVCTVGPASREESILRQLIRAGMDVARLNFSHGRVEEHEKAYRAVRRLASREGRTVGVMLDLQGPKIRVGEIPGEPLVLRRGASFTLTTRGKVAGPGAVSVTYPRLPRDVSKGDRILLDDGLIQLTVHEVHDREVECRVVEGGLLHSRKGVNLPGSRLRVPSLTAKDRRDLTLGLEWGVDFVALSFVRKARDVQTLRRAMKKHGAATPLIAKLEKPQAVENLSEILEAADGIMVARGDLGVEMSPERVPVLQKQMIHEARLRGKPVITATQMLESMVNHPRPTRAEASDVANAILDGTDAVMLSAETAVGKYPVEAVRLMARVIEASEAWPAFPEGPPPGLGEWGGRSIPAAVGRAATQVAREMNAAAIAVFTQGGGTAVVVSQHHPRTPVYAYTPVEEVERRLSLVWGIQPRRMPPLRTTDRMVEMVEERLRSERVVKPGDVVVVIAGTPVAVPGSTNFMKIHTVGS